MGGRVRWTDGWRVEGGRRVGRREIYGRGDDSDGDDVNTGRVDMYTLHMEVGRVGGSKGGRVVERRVGGREGGRQ